jgi:hypothetical protein
MGSRRSNGRVYKLIDDVAIERVPLELADRVRAATAHCQHRRIERRGEGYAVSAMAGECCGDGAGPPTGRLGGGDDRYIPARCRNRR